MLAVSMALFKGNGQSMDAGSFKLLYATQLEMALTAWSRESTVVIEISTNSKKLEPSASKQACRYRG